MRQFLVLLLVLVMFFSAGPLPTAAAVDDPLAALGEPDGFVPIQPGAKHVAYSGGTCTLNAVFKDAAGALYVGAAAHCSPPEGARLRVPDVGEVGDVVYRGIRGPDGERRQDFALVRIDEDKHHLVDPSLRYWGGPTAVEERFLPGTPLLQHGYGAGFRANAPTRLREGVLELVYGDASVSNGDTLDGWFLAMMPILGGDSGSLIITADGRALGVAIGAAPTWGEPGTINGPTFPIILSDLRARGIDVELVTAPFRPNDPRALGAETAWYVQDQCLARPVGGTGSTNACVGPPFDMLKEETREQPEGMRGPLIIKRTIEAASPHTMHVRVSGAVIYATGEDGPLDVDAFIFDAPPPGTLVGTFTTSPGGAPYDVDIEFYPRVGDEESSCVSISPDEICRVPPSARQMAVVGYFGVHLEVSVHEVIESS